MSIFDERFPGVRSMLEADRDAHNAQGARETANGSPWKVLGLNLGKWQVESSHATEEDANAALASIHSTCAPFVRDCFRVARQS